jgi:hypothetical protein
MKEAIVGVVICWAVTGYAIWKWGPGLRRRFVRCPEKKVLARVLAVQREAEFGCLHVVDVKTCSLVASTPLNCSKQCTTRL